MSAKQYFYIGINPKNNYLPEVVTITPKQLREGWSVLYEKKPNEPFMLCSKILYDDYLHTEFNEVFTSRKEAELALANQLQGLRLQVSNSLVAVLRETSGWNKSKLKKSLLSQIVYRTSGNLETGLEEIKAITLTKAILKNAKLTLSAAGEVEDVVIGGDAWYLSKQDLLTGVIRSHEEEIRTLEEEIDQENERILSARKNRELLRGQLKSVKASLKENKAEYLKLGGALPLID